MKGVRRGRPQQGTPVSRGSYLAAAVLAATLSSVGARARANTPVALPDGPGRELIERKCTQCHSLDTVMRSRRTRGQWEAQLDTMISRGARLSDEDFERIADYLEKQLGLPAKE